MYNAKYPFGLHSQLHTNPFITSGHIHIYFSYVMAMSLDKSASQRMLENIDLLKTQCLF